MKASFLKIRSGIENDLKAKLTRAQSIKTFFMRVTLNQYYNAQKMRWDTENRSEEEEWLPLSPEYKKEKEKKFAEYPGSGRQLMIATGKLAKSATGMDLEGQEVIATDTSLTINLNTSYLPYAEYAAEVRPVMEFSDKTISEMHAKLRQFIIKGVE